MVCRRSRSFFLHRVRPVWVHVVQPARAEARATPRTGGERGSDTEMTPVLDAVTETAKKEKSSLREPIFIFLVFPLITFIVIGGAAWLLLK